MSTVLEPPISPSQDAPPPPPRASSTVVMWIAVSIGAVVVLGSVASGVVGALSSIGGNRHTVSTASATGIDSLDVSISGGSFSVEFADVGEARLDASGSTWGGGDWTLERRGGELELRSPSRVFGWWFGGPQHATLVLPSSLDRGTLDATYELTGGSMEIEGDYRTLAVNIGAGDLRVVGTADELTADVNAGSADLDIADVSSATVGMSAGSVTARFTGEAPDSVTAEVSAGSMDLVLPDQTYRVTNDVSAGSLDNRLRTSASSPRTVAVSVSAGEIVLRPGR